MEIMVVVIIVIAVVSVSRAKAAGQEKQARQERLQQQERTRMTSHYSPAAPAAQVPGQIHLSDLLPDQKPPAVPVAQPAQSARMPFTPTEGVAFHPPGFHGDDKPRASGSMEKKPLEKADLGAERARQNAHTAGNANWTAPKESAGTQEKKTQRTPMYTAKQLRDAFIMQEIIDVPVSRRKESRRGYGS